MMHSIILASASPRRQEILARIGVPFEVQVSGVDEDIRGIPLREAPRELAIQKATYVSSSFPQHLVLGYDTLVYLDGNALGKPANEQEAREMLQSLRGREHEVLTGYCLIQNGKLLGSGTESTFVAFRDFTDPELDDYIAIGESLDKAGAYGIQSCGARFVKGIRGCYYNVAGLPVAATLDLLKPYLR